MTLPEGLTYVPGFLTEAEERDVLAVVATFPLHPYVLHGTPSRRLVRSFGLAQAGGGYDAGPAAPIPAGLQWLRERCAGLMGREPRELVDLLVTRYLPLRSGMRCQRPGRAAVSCAISSLSRRNLRRPAFVVVKAALCFRSCRGCHALGAAERADGYSKEWPTAVVRSVSQMGGDPVTRISVMALKALDPHWRAGHCG